MTFSAIFDMDGVITDTVKIHFLAWKKVFDAYLLTNTSSDKNTVSLFTEADYVRYVDGISREDGVRNFLTQRQLLPKHKTSAFALIEQLAIQKDQIFIQSIQQQGVQLFASTIRLILHLKKQRIKIAVISASKNALWLLQKAQLSHLFDVIIDGNQMQATCLPGKPCPDIFLEATKQLGALPHQTLVVEDALAGIQAAHAAHIQVVIGIDRRNTWQKAFYHAGATLVVTDLAKLAYADLIKLFSGGPASALQRFDALASAFDQKHIAVFLDFDGTLAPIAPTPQQAVLPKTCQNILKQLSALCPVAIISGRELADITQKIAVPELFYAGNHGLEIAAPAPFDFHLKKAPALLDTIKAIEPYVKQAVQGIPNCLIENKKFSLSVHYRLVEKKYVTAIKKQLLSILLRFPQFELKPGRKVFEIRPKIPWHKGKAIRYLLEQLTLTHKDSLAIYIGDDQSDEDAFAEIADTGIAIVVSKKQRKSQAHYRLTNPQEVCAFLQKLQHYLSTQQNCHLPCPPAWLLEYRQFNPQQQKFREALCTLSNGYFATRGSYEEANRDHVHYPGTYCAGCYNALESVVDGKTLSHEDMVNMPNWLCLTFQLPEAEHWFGLQYYTVLDFSQYLDLWQGTLTRCLTIQDKCGRITTLHYWRLVSMAQPNSAMIRLVFQAVNWSGQVVFKSGLNGHIHNTGVAIYQALNHHHLHFLQSGLFDTHGIFLKMRTHPYTIEIAEVACHRLYKNGQPCLEKPLIEKSYHAIYQHYPIVVHEKDRVLIEKTVTLVTSKQRAISDCLSEAKQLAAYSPSYQALVRDQRNRWQNLWHKADIKIDGSSDLQRTVRFHIFHLLQTISAHCRDLDVSVPARGLHGEAYHGHIFWDELFIIPYYVYFFPTIVRSLLLYRYRRLDRARLLAKQAGLQGALYPWQSASDGSEVTEKILFNPENQKWNPDYSFYQRHINGAIVYNIWHYYLVTDDMAFLCDYGAEIILEIAHCWASLCHFNTDTHRYEIHHVVGPDEYHEKYPDSDQPGLNNNAYTNILAVWSLDQALKILKLLPKEISHQLSQKLSIDQDTITTWRAITHNMTVPFHQHNIISQFEGYEQLREFPWDAYQQSHHTIERLDRILNAEGDSVNRYKASKQADVLMLFYLFSQQELHNLLRRLGYDFTGADVKANVDYYVKRTCHGSTLSKAVLAYIYTHIDHEQAFHYLNAALHCDIGYTPITTTHEGIHFGSMALCISLIQRCYIGLRIIHRKMNFSPKLPKAIHRITCQLYFRNRHFTVTVDQQQFEIHLSHDAKRGLNVIIYDANYYLKPGMTFSVCTRRT